MSAATSPLSRDQVALGILAGGQARRLGGADKALAIFQGQTLAEHTLESAGSGFAQILLSYNGSAGAALPRRARLVPDQRRDFPGPLAGIESMLAVADSEWMLSLPVDLANIPADLFERLASACDGVNGVAAFDAEGEQPLVALWPVESSRAAVRVALDAGERAVHRVQQALAFTNCGLAPLRLGNLNSPLDFEAGA